MVSLVKSAMIFAITALTSSTLAQDSMKILKPEQIVWKDHPVFAGIQSAVLFGDPTRPEMYVIRSKLPPNYATPAHTHPNTEVLTVLSGSLGVGMGEKNEKRGEMLKAGSIWVHAAKPAHYIWTGNEETIVQRQGVGPVGVEFVNTADDPRKK
jgi:quercetin dioxygenase-like cupin family protein